MTREDMLDCLHYELENLRVARGSDYSGVEAIEMAINALEAQEKAQKVSNNSSELDNNFGAFDALPPAVPQPELYGFTLEYLILFALTCRKAGIENRDLKNFMMNTKLIYEVVRKDFEVQMKEAIDTGENEWN